MVTGAEFAGATDGFVQVLQAGDQLHQPVVAEGRKIRTEAAAQNVVGGFGELHAERRRRGEVAAAVLRILLGDQQVFGLEQFDLAADAGFGLAEAGGDGALLDARVPFQHH